MSDGFVDRLRRTVIEEIRSAGLLNCPPQRSLVPCDLDAEAELCSAALGGYARPSELDLPAVDFHSRLMQHVWVAADWAIEHGREPTDATILAALAANDFRGVGLEEELFRIRHCQPFVTLPGLRALAARVRELAAARRLIERLERLEFDLRSGLPVSEARRTLARLCGVE